MIALAHKEVKTTIIMSKELQKAMKTKKNRNYDKRTKYNPPVVIYIVINWQTDSKCYTEM